MLSCVICARFVPFTDYVIDEEHVSVRQYACTHTIGGLFERLCICVPAIRNDAQFFAVSSTTCTPGGSGGCHVLSCAVRHGSMHAFDAIAD